MKFSEIRPRGHGACAAIVVLALWLSYFDDLCPRWLNIPGQSWFKHAWSLTLCWNWGRGRGVLLVKGLGTVRNPRLSSRLHISWAPTFQDCQSISLGPSFLFNKIDVPFYEVAVYVNMYTDICVTYVVMNNTIFQSYRDSMRTCISIHMCLSLHTCMHIHTHPHSPTLWNRKVRHY